MKTRGFAVVLAILLAAVATGAVYLYVHGVKQENHVAAKSVPVVVSKADIQPGAALDPLLAQGQFELKNVPGNLLVQGAVTSLDQLRGQTTSSAILAGEQVSLARLQGTAQHTGGILGIRDGFQAVTISLDGPHAGGGYIQAGDHVTIYGEGDINLIQGDFRKLLGQPVATTKTDIGDWVFTVVPDVRVLHVFNAGGGAGTTTGPAGTSNNLQLTLELKPEDAQRVVIARENFSIWLALQPPGQRGETLPPTNAPFASLRGTQ
jgi:Flp pilus assembly protein CpaB